VKIERPLFVPLKAEYFDAFARGDKTVEYRLAGGPWNATTCRVGRPVTLSRGYGTQRRLDGIVTGFAERWLSDLNANIRHTLRAIYDIHADDARIACVSIRVQSPAAREATTDGSDSLSNDGGDLILIDVPPSHPSGEREG
jgi:hypothetical protein